MPAFVKSFKRANIVKRPCPIDSLQQYFVPSCSCSDSIKPSSFDFYRDKIDLKSRGSNFVRKRKLCWPSNDPDILDWTSKRTLEPPCKLPKIYNSDSDDAIKGLKVGTWVDLEGQKPRELHSKLESRSPKSTDGPDLSSKTEDFFDLDPEELNQKEHILNDVTGSDTELFVDSLYDFGTDNILGSIDLSLGTKSSEQMNRGKQTKIIKRRANIFTQDIATDGPNIEPLLDKLDIFGADGKQDNRVISPDGLDGPDQFGNPGGLVSINLEETQDQMDSSPGLV